MRHAIIAGFVGLSLACAPGEPRWRVGEPELAAPAGSGEPHLTATADGRAVLSWFEPSEAGHALRLAVRTEAGWSAPRTVVEGDRFFVNWADFPSVLVRDDGSWVVHWLEKVAAAPYAYHVTLAISADEGVTWSEPIRPHRDTSPTEHGFVSMVPWRGGAALVWLDGRQMDGVEEGQGEMSVRFTTIGPGGTLGPDVLIDDRTCECCQTALARTPEGLVAAYRDRSPEEIRDVAVVWYRDGEWSKPRHVGDDHWRYPGCPVNGPQLAARDETAAIAWFTAPEQNPAVYAAFAAGGPPFGPPTRVDDGNPEGRVDVELLADGSALVVWLERVGDGAEIRARQVHPGGGKAPSWTVGSTGGGRASGFPRMVRVGDEVLFAWTLTGPAGGVRVAAARPGGD